MRWRNTLTALLLLVGLTIVYYLVDVRGGEARQRRAELEARVLGLPDEEAIRGLEIRNAAGEFRLEREEGVWRLLAPLEARADRDEVSGIVSSLKRLRVVRRLKGVEEGPAGFGLEPSAASLTVFPEGDAEPRSLEVGERAALGGGYYARRMGSSEVLVVAAGVERALSVDLEELRDRKIVNLDSWNVDRVRIESASGPVAFARTADGAWSITDPVEFPADRDRVREFVDAMCELRASTFVETDAPAPGLDPPVAVVTLSAGDPDGAARVEVGARVEEPAGRYVRRADGSVVQVPDEFTAALDRPVDDWRRHRVVGLDRWDLRRIDVSHPDGRLVIAKDPSSSDWTRLEPEGGDLGQTEMGSFLDSLYDLDAVSFRARPPEDVVQRLLAPDWLIHLEGRRPGAGGDDEPATEVLQLAGPVGDVLYARIEGTEDLFVLPPDALEAVRSALEVLAGPGGEPGSGVEQG